MLHKTSNRILFSSIYRWLVAVWAGGGVPDGDTLYSVNDEPLDHVPGDLQQ